MKWAEVLKVIAAEMEAVATRPVIDRENHEKVGSLD
jgi:hypothetical protein